MAILHWRNGVAGDWNIAANWDLGATPGLADAVLIDAAGSYSVAISGADSAASLTLNAAGATVVDTGNLTLGGALALTAGSFDLAAGGQITGGTLSAAGGSFAWNGGTLSGATYQGVLDLTAAGASLIVANGLTMTGAGGVGAGTINANGAATSLTFAGTQTLDNVTLNAGNAAGPTATAINFGDLTLGLHAVLNEQGATSAATQSIESGTSLTNNGTIQTTQAGAGATIAATTLVNNGLISDLAGATLLLQTTNLTNNGTIAGVGGIGVSATNLTNNGVFTDAGGVSATNFVNNGTFNDNGGFATTPGAFTNNGVFNLGGYNTYLALIGTFSGTPATGGTGAGTINMIGSLNQLRLMGSQSFDAGTITLSGTSEQIIVGTGQTSGVGQLTLGALAAIDHLGGTTQLTGGQVVVNGAINASGLGGLLTINPQSLVDNGTISVTGGDRVLFGTSVTGSGRITIGSGGIAEIGGNVASTDTVAFTDTSSATLRLDLGSVGGFKSTIQGFSTGNTIDLGGIVATSASWSNGVLTVAGSGWGMTGPITLAMAGNYAGATFHIAGDGLLATPPGFGFGIYPGSNITVTGAGAPAPAPRVYGGTGAAVSAAEGSAITAALASFTDSNAADVASQFSASILWGDGTTTAGTVSGAAGSFSVAGNHAYADEGSFVTAVSITNSADNVTTTLAGSATAVEADVLAATGAPAITASAGLTFNGTVASFSDTYLATAAADLAATITWGDGTTSVGTVSGGNGSFSVAGSHAYAGTGSDAVSVVLKDTHGTAMATATTTATVAAAPAVAATGLTVLSVSDASLGPAGVFTTPNVNSASATATTIPGSISASSSATASDAVHASSVTTNQTVTAAWTSNAAGTATFQDTWSSTNVQLGVNNAGQAYGMQAGPDYANATFNVSLATAGTFNLAWTALLSGTGPLASWGTTTAPVGESGFLNMVVSIDGGAAMQVSPAANVVPTGSFSGALAAGAHSIKIMDWSNYSGVEFTSTGAFTETLNLSVTPGSPPPPPAPRVYGGTGAAVSAAEGSAITAPLASFTDSNAADVASQFSASILWGDGTTTAGTVSGAAGSFSVAGNHAYADEGSFVTAVSITNSADNVTTTLAGSATAVEADVLAATGAPAIAATAGLAFTGTVASFTDTYLATAAGDLAATITWGDGTTSAGTVTGGNGSFSVAGSHAYAATGSDAVSVVLSDVHGTATATATTTATVASPYAGSGATLSAAEGSAVTAAIASFTDANLGDTAAAFSASILWGDGTTTAGTVTGANGSFSVAGSHAYADEGSFAVATTVTHIADAATLALAGKVTAVEADVFAVTAAPAIATTAGAAFSGTVASFSDLYLATAAADLAATITWGDGTTSAGTVSGGNGSFSVAGSHTYAAAGTDAVSVVLADVHGTATATAAGSATVAAVVVPPPPPPGGLVLTTGEDHLTGGAGDDIFVARSNTLSNGDTLNGGLGTNTLQLSGGGVFNLSIPDAFTAIQVVSTQEGAGAAMQTVTLRENTHFLVNVAADPAATPGAGITIIGADNADVITLGKGNDTVVLGVGETVNGGGGVATYQVNGDTIGDTINGGTGSNTLLVVGGGDLAMGANITGITKVQLAAPTHFTANATAGMAIAGSAAGGDTITIGAASQSVVSGGANEHIRVTAANAGAAIGGVGAGSTLEITTGGTATLADSTSIGTIKLDGATNLMLSKMSFLTAVGSSAADSITAGATGQTLTGGGGADTLTGFSGGFDIFKDTASGLNGDLIRGFVATDSIDVSNLAFAGAALKVAVSGGNTLLTLTSGSTKSAFTMAGSWSAAGFHLATDNAGGTLLTHS